MFQVGDYVLWNIVIRDIQEPNAGEGVVEFLDKFGPGYGRLGEG